jgi:hypothetical protein
MVRLILPLLLLAISTLPVSGQELGLTLVKTFSGNAHGVRKAVFAPDSKSFATAGTRGEVKVWDVASGQRLTQMDGHMSSVNDLRFGRDGRFIVTAAADGFVIVWDVSSGKSIRRIRTSSTNAERPDIKFALLSDDGQKVFFAVGKELRMAVVGDDTPVSVLYTDRKDPISAAALSPDGRELLFSAGQYLIVLDISSGKVVREYNTGTCEISSLSYSADGKLMLSWCSNARVDIRDASTLMLKTSFRSGTGGRKYSNMALTSDQRYVITCDHASRFNLWDLQEKRLVMDEGADQGTVLGFDVASNADLVLSASLDKTVKLWKIGEKLPDDTDKKSKRPEPEPAQEPQVVILMQSETLEDFTPVEVREEAPTSIQTVAEPLKATTVANSAPVIAKTEPAPKALGDSVSVLPERLNGRRVKPIRSDHKLNLLGRELTIEVWDAQVVDGDIISLYINDDVILEEFSIVSDRKTVHFDATPFRKAYLFLHAHNVGSIPPNTATMMISDGIQQIQVELRSDLTGSAAMELNFVNE